MKSGVVVSTILHTAVLTWGLWSLSAPEPLEVANIESFPVEIVPIESLSQSMVGAKDAPLTETPAPKPTEKPQTLPMPAENIGDNEADLETPPTPVDRPKASEQAAAAKPAEAPAPEPQPEPEPAPPPPAETPPPPPDPVTAEAPAETPPPVDAVEQAIASAEAAPAEPPLPQNVPVPSTKPKPPAPVVAENKPEPEKPEPAKETRTAEARTPEESQFDADKIAALLNKEQSAGGGAKRSEEQASLGTERTTGAKLSQSELDALRGQIQRCWSPPSGVSEAGSLRISIQMRLDSSGQLEARPEIVDGGGSSMIERIAGEAALRAVQRCAPYNLPADKYETWADVVVNFDPSQMF